MVQEKQNWTRRDNRLYFWEEIQTNLTDYQVEKETETRLCKFFDSKRVKIDGVHNNEFGLAIHEYC